MLRKPVSVLFFVVLLDLIGFGIVVPVLPYYSKVFGASATTLGWLMMSYSAMQFLFSPFWGRLSDRIGRRPVLLVCTAGLAVSMVVLGMAQSLFWLFAGRILAGFFGGSISTANATMADITAPEDRAKGMGLIGAAFGIGFLIGPALGGFLSRWGYGTAALVAAGLSGLNFVFACFALREPSLTEEERAAHRNSRWMKVFWKVVSSPSTGLVVFLFFLVTLGMAQLETSFALYLLARFGLDAFHAGLLLAMMALVMIAIQGGLIGRFVKWVGEKKLVETGGLLMAASLVAAVAAPKVSLLIPALLVYAFGYGITNPSLSSLVSRNADAGTQGGTMGVYHAAGSLGRILGPIGAGFLFDQAGIKIPFLAASAIFSAVFLIASFTAIHRR